MSTIAVIGNPEPRSPHTRTTGLLHLRDKAGDAPGALDDRPAAAGSQGTAVRTARQD